MTRRARTAVPQRLEKKHPLAIRWFHWINFPVLMVMIWSGLLIYWANDVYRLGWGKRTLLHFFPQAFYEKLHLESRLAEGMAWHFAFMWIFFLNGLLYVLYTAWSGEWRFLLPGRSTLREAIQVVLHDLKIRKQPLPRRKFNGAQQIAYTSIIVMGLGSLLTGLSIYKPVQFAFLTTLLGGYGTARFLHFWLTVGYCLFFLIHVAQVARAGWNNFRAMITGYELVPVTAKHYSQTDAQDSNMPPQPPKVATGEPTNEPSIAVAEPAIENPAMAKIACECPPSHRLAKRVSASVIGALFLLVLAFSAFNFLHR